MHHYSILEILGGLSGVLVFAIIIIIIAKKENKELDNAGITTEIKEKLLNSGLKEYGKGKVTTTSYIYKIADKGNKVEIKVLFYNGYFHQNMMDSIKISREEEDSKNYKVGDFITTVHKVDKDKILRVKGVL